MKSILNFKKFENSESDDAKQGLEFILLDLKDIGVNYSIIGRSKFLDNPHDDWFKNTRVERGFTSYFSLNVSTNKEQIETIISILKECINYMTNQGWKYHTTIDRGVRIVDVNIDQIVPLFNQSRDISKYLGQIHIHFWKL